MPPTRARHVALIAVAVLLGLANACRGGSDDTAQAMDRTVREYVDRAEFMGAVAVNRGDEVVFSRAYGLANVEWAVPNTLATKFRIGSLSKQFTAAAILLLEQDGKLRVEDPLKQHLSVPAAWEGITVHHLLTHTSGIANYTRLPDYAAAKRQPSPLDRTYAWFRPLPLAFAPGTSFEYSNSGYTLLALLIESLSGQKYPDFLRERIFGPLQMKDSGTDSKLAVIPNRASGYTRPPGSSGGYASADFIDPSIATGGGSLYSTTADLARWGRGLFGGKLLSARSLEKMTTPFKAGYAYGLDIAPKNGRKRIIHGGGIEGFNSFFMYYPETSVSVVVLANQETPVARDIASRLGQLAHDASAAESAKVAAKASGGPGSR